MNEIRVAYENNHDGFGIMWVENGRVQVNRGLYNFDEIKELIRQREGSPYAFHMRWRTVGKIAEEQCHPFKVLDMDEGHSQDMYMMHNGTFCGLSHSVKSDSQIFSEFLSAMLADKSAEEIAEMLPGDIDQRVDSSNKVLFMDNTGKTFIAGEKRGIWISGVWYSNLYSFHSRKLARAQDDIITQIMCASALYRRQPIPTQIAIKNVEAARLARKRRKELKRQAKLAKKQAKQGIQKSIQVQLLSSAKNESENIIKPAVIVTPAPRRREGQLYLSSEYAEVQKHLASQNKKASVSAPLQRKSVQVIRTQKKYNGRLVTVISYKYEN
jgi:predicted glutamine amidotransferase